MTATAGRRPLAQSAFAGVLLCALGFCTEASAKESPCATSDEPGWRCELTIGKHRFLPTSTMRGAFMASRIRLDQSVTRQLFLGVPLPGLPGAADLTLYSATEDLRLALALRQRVLLFGGLFGRLSAGADLPSAFASGARGAWGWQLGLGIKLFRVPATGTQLSLSIEAENDKGTALVPAELWESMLHAPADAASALTAGNALSMLLSKQESFLWGGRLALAQVLYRHLGMQLELGYRGGPTHYVLNRNGSPIERRGSRSLLQAAAAVSLSGAPEIPLGLVLEYAYRRAEDQGIGRLDGTLEYLPHWLAVGAYVLTRSGLVISLHLARGISALPAAEANQLNLVFNHYF